MRSLSTRVLAALSAIVLLTAAAAAATAARGTGTRGAVAFDDAGPGSIGFSPANPTRADAVQFTAPTEVPDDPNTVYLWTFQDAGTSPDRNPSETFPTLGTHHVTLHATNVPAGFDKTYETDVTVTNAPPIVQCTIGPPTRVNPGTSVSFSSAGTSDPDGTITSLSWAFGDRATSSDPNPSHPYAQPGSYPVTLQATDNDATSVPGSCGTVSVNSPPVATFRYTASRPGLPTRFDATGSTDPDGHIASYSWNFGDPLRVDNSASGPQASHTYVDFKSHVVTLTVTDNEGETATFQTTVVPGNVPPTVSIDTPASPLSGQAVALHARASDQGNGRVVSYAWDLDADGQYDDATGSSPSRAFATPGRHVVAVKVTDDDGASSVATAVVNVRNRPPHAWFRYAPGKPRVGQTIKLRSTSTDPDGSVAQIAWDLNGDGKYGKPAGNSSRVVFGKPGRHRIGLRVRDAMGATVSVTRVIRVYAIPLLKPFPVVRIAGAAYTWGARLTLVKVRVPSRATVTVACFGRDCFSKPWRKRARRSGVVRVPVLERSLAVGDMIVIKVTRAGAVGKYTRLRIMAHKPPRRYDACLKPHATKPSRCPS